MKIYAVAVLVLTGGLCVNALLSVLQSPKTLSSANTGAGGLLGGLLGGGNGGLLGGVLGGNSGGLLGGLLGGGGTGGLLSGVLGGGGTGGLLGGGLLNLNSLLSGLTDGGLLKLLDIPSVLAKLDLTKLTSLDVSGLLSALTNNTNLDLSSLLQGITGKDGVLSVVTKLLQKILCLVKSLQLPLVKELLATINQNDLLGLEKICSAPGGSDLLSGLLPGLLNGTLGGLTGGLQGLINSLQCILPDLASIAPVKLPLVSGLLQAGSLGCKNGSALGDLGGLNVVLDLVNNLLGGVIPAQALGEIVGNLLNNLGLKADILKGINLEEILTSLTCVLKSLRQDVVVQLVKNVANSLELKILDTLCQSDKGLLDYLIENINNITEPILRKIFCLIDNKLSNVVKMVGVANIDAFVGGMCSNGTLVGLLQNFGSLIEPLLQKLIDTIGITGITLDGILQLLESAGIANVEELKLFLVQIDCIFRSVSFDLIPILIESLSKDVLIKMAPALCSLGKLDNVIVGLLTGVNWEKLQAFLYVGGLFDLPLFQKLICLATRFGVTEAISMIQSAADITKYYNLFPCENGTPTTSLFDEVKRNCVNGLSQNCQTALSTVVMKNNCDACTTGTGCNQLNGLLPQDVVTECNAKCVACKNG